MTKQLDIFFEVHCLTEQSRQLNGLVLQKKWFRKADKRMIGQYLQKFIQYNSNQFKFLGVQPVLSGTDQNILLSFKTTDFIGSIPLRASDTGKQIGDFIVTPRFIGKDKFEDYVEILNLLEKEISPEFADSLPLASGNNYRPPFYLEAVKYIKAIEALIMKPWKKFDNIEKVSEQPLGQINWNKYIDSEYKVENRLRFPVRKNILSEFHSEYAEIRYVFDLCKLEILSSNTPPRIKNTIKPQINFIEEKLYLHKPKTANKIFIRASDNQIVRNCKKQANKILNFHFVDSTAWRVNFSDVFEKFVQYIFKETTRETGGRLYSNFKIQSYSSKKYRWELKHIEPDAIYQKDSMLVFIDAKYKSNLYNKFGTSDALKEEYRRDLHQIMAYSSFSNSFNKYGFLCYPSNKVEHKTVRYKNRINEIENTITILGIPLKKESIRETVRLLTTELNCIEIKLTVPNSMYCK